MSPEYEALKLIPSIYRVCVDDTCVQACVDDMMSVLHVPLGWALQTPGMGKPNRGAIAGVELSVVDSYRDDYYEQDPAMLAGHRINGGRLISLDGLLSSDEQKAYRKSDFFCGYIQPGGYEGTHFCFFNFKEEWPESSFFACRFLDSAHHLAGRELELLELLVPHIETATNTWRTLRAERERAAQSIEAMDLLPTGVVLVDFAASVMHANKTARTLLDADDGLYVQHRSLCLRAHDADRRLSKLIYACARTAHGKGITAGGALTVPRASGKRPYEIFVAPLFGARHADALDLPAAAIVFISDPEQRIAPPEEILRTLYHLTPSEARLAVSLANDRNLSKAADRRGLTVGSARVMLKRIFDKTGTHRQASLVRLLNHGPLSMFTSKRDLHSD